MKTLKVIEKKGSLHLYSFLDLKMLTSKEGQTIAIQDPTLFEQEIFFSKINFLKLIDL